MAQVNALVCIVEVVVDVGFIDESVVLRRV
jgi:hypothetical protein